MNQPRCTKAHGCMSPVACSGWRYCRERNIDAGGMKNVTPELQGLWRETDLAAAELSA